LNLGSIGITSAAFWVVALLGLVLLVPFARRKQRSCAAAFLNLAFLGWVQHRWLLATLALLLLSYAAVVLVDRGRLLRRRAYLAAVSATLGLFIAFKTPALARHLPPAPMLWLSGMGFSYMALRFLDELALVRDKGGAPGLVEHVNYLVPFHMLAAGPIQAFADFKATPAVSEPLSFAQALGACERVALGLFKKLVLAHLIERLFLTGFRSHGLYYVLEVQLFLPWLYLDFSSYSDIAVGVGRLLGIVTPENFDRPYLARDMVDFWQRWHISLSHWIRRNVFVPLQMALQRRYPDRSPLVTSSITLGISFGFCGLWHMVSWRFAAWGVMHALGVVAANASQALSLRKLGRAGYQAYRRRPLPRVIGIVLTFEFVAWSLAIVGGRA
jgi:D-alanyl-lipoteichoic acid acyltransferase DltB (MBOAT superfamily)